MTTHAMIDIETLGARPDTVVLTIGGVKFDPNWTDGSFDEFYYRLEVDDQLEQGRSTDQSTLDWWAKQDPAVMEEALGDGNRTPIDDVLNQLRRWCVGVDAIWCQGSTFDVPILENLHRQYEHHVPWAFWQIRDSRTLFQIMPEDPKKKIKFNAHHALDDCKVQASCVQSSLKQLGLKI